jgi:hypothetical protein
MAAIETKLAEALTEIKNIRISLTKEVEERQRDHDELVKLREQVITLFNKVGELKSKDEQTEEELQTFRPLVEKVKLLTLWKDARDRTENGEIRVAIKETNKRVWQVVLLIIGAFASAIAGGLASKYLFK